MPAWEKWHTCASVCLRLRNRWIQPTETTGRTLVTWGVGVGSDWEGGFKGLTVFWT